MKMLCKVSMLVLISTSLIGCATNSDIQNIQTQIDGLKTSVAQASSDAASAQTAANDAKTAAERAAQYSEDASSKLDRIFKKRVTK